jgi:hypothetical protein
MKQYLFTTNLNKKEITQLKCFILHIMSKIFEY